MDNLTIPIFRNQIFLEIINELKILSKFKFSNFENLDLCINQAKKHNQLVVFFKDKTNHQEYMELIKNNVPMIVVCNPKVSKENLSGELVAQVSMPFKILDYEKKIVSLIAKNEFKKNSFIDLNGYTIDKNERKLKKNDLELQLSEKEINFLILFSEEKEPISRNSVLKKVWNYSSESDTHTVETHIHRLRKKILEKFNDNNFIKNNYRGYYI